MDKLIKRTRMGERQVARRLAKRKEMNQRISLIDLRRHQVGLRREARVQMAHAIEARHEKWELGPLAPQKDVPVIPGPGEVFTVIPQWGSISGERAQANKRLSRDAVEARCAWAGGSKYLCIKKGDRVAVIEGWLKGRIAEISELDMESGQLHLVDIARTNMTMPRYMTPIEAGQQNVFPLDAPLPISAVRLVYPLEDKETGVVRDVVIRQLKPMNIHHDRPTRTTEWDRYVPGLNVEIPWPKSEPETFQDNEVDTLRIDVEEKSFVPTLLRPPMPETVINELRNQYSKFRTRHTEEYIAKKQAEEAEKKARLDSAKSMLTPLQEFNRRQRELRRSRGQPVLTDEMMGKIGEVMARNQKRILQGSGVGEIERGAAAMSLETPPEPPAQTQPPAR